MRGRGGGAHAVGEPLQLQLLRPRQLLCRAGGGKVQQQQQQHQQQRQHLLAPRRRSWARVRYSQS